MTSYQTYDQDYKNGITRLKIKIIIKIFVLKKIYELFKLVI